MTNFGKKINGFNFLQSEIDAVWNKGIIIPGKDPNFWRKDPCGATMFKSDHGNTNSKTGWEIDHIYPVARGGNDDLINLQPLQWENNRSKGDQYPAINYCVIKN